MTPDERTEVALFRHYYGISAMERDELFWGEYVALRDTLPRLMGAAE